MAWMCHGCNPGNFCYLSWTVNYSLQWSSQGSLSKGIKFRCAGSKPANLKTGERQILSYDTEAYTFTGPANSGAPGTIGVHTDGSVKNDECLVAIAVANKPIAVVPIGPNTAVTFTPKPVYYLTFGDDTEGGLLDVCSLILPITLNFEAQGVKHLEYTLNGYNEWVQVKPKNMLY